MLHLYQSNRLEHLTTLFTSMLQAVPLTDMFAAEIVMVQSRGMGRWLSLSTAKTLGIAAHFEFVLPAGYAWRLMRATLPALPEQSVFSPDIMHWHLLACLPELDDPVFAPVQHYLRAGELACFELAGRIADIFDQYLVFRPDWIRIWEQGRLVGLGPDEAWQAALWQRLVADLPGQHRVSMSDAFLRALKPDLLPERITLFGIASLAPMYLAMVRRLAELTDVCLFLLNPCQEYWGDIVDARGQMHLPLCDDETRPDHPLLASLGKQGRDFFDLVAETLHDTHPLWLTPEDGHLLARLQTDMLQLQPPVPALVPATDRSIEIHAVHGPMRELEVLKDRLLDCFAQDSTLMPADIAVLTPDINLYAPYIDAVFGARTDAAVIPFSIADRRVGHELPLLTAFNRLLQLLDSRFLAEDLLSLLETPAILRRFGLRPQDLPLTGRWVEAAGIRWGRDAQHKQQCNLPGDAMFTWRWGLDRLLLGSVLPPALAGEDAALCAGLLPVPLAVGADVTVLARLMDFYDQLAALAEDWRIAAPLADWRYRLFTACEQLFAVDDEEESALAFLHETISALATEGAMAGLDQAVSLEVVREWLQQRLTQASINGFLAGGVTFCAMVPMRSIPFRVLCLIGLNDGAYPRDERPLSFDLIASHPRRGDRSRRFDDRYLFLEALLSARDKLYLSYVGQSVRSNEALPPSALLSELLDVLELMGAKPQQLLIRHPLQAFSGKAYDGVDPRLQSYETMYAEALSLPPQQPQPFAASLSVSLPASLAISDWLRFWHLPCRDWLASRLGIHLPRQQQAQSVREPFVLDRDAGADLLAKILNAGLAGQPANKLATEAMASGTLPAAALGEACWQQSYRQGQAFVARLPAAVQMPPLAPRGLQLEIDGLRLNGMLSGLRPAGLLRCRPGKATSTDLLDLWLNHLLLCASAPAGITPFSVLHALDACYRLPAVQNPASLLLPWIRYWRAGQAMPLPFFPRTSLACAQQWLKTPDDWQKALAAAKGKWAAEGFQQENSQPQSAEPAVALAFRHLAPLEDPLFAELVRELLLPMLRCLQKEAA